MTRSERPRLLHAFSTFELGGPQARFVKLHAETCDSFEHIVTTMDGRYGALDSRGVNQSIDVREMPVEKGSGLANVQRFRTALLADRPDAVISYNWGAIEWAFAAALARIPHVHVEEGFNPDEIHMRLRRRNWTRMVALRVSNARVVTVSETLYQIAQREWLIPARRLLLIPNGVPTERFRSVIDRTRPSVYARDRELIVGTVAGLRPEKRIDRLIDAFGMLVQRGVDARLVIVGDGACRADLVHQIHVRGIKDRVIFLGHLKDPAPLYYELDLFALTSDTEQMPVALVEAMASGLACVATAVGDVTQMLGPSNREYVVERDTVAVADALCRLISADAARRRLGAENLGRAKEKYSYQPMVDAWRAVFASGRVC